MAIGSYAFSGMGPAAAYSSARRMSRLADGSALGAYRKWREYQLRPASALGTCAASISYGWDLRDDGPGVAYFFARPGSSWLPPTMNADASPGFPRMAYPSAAAAMHVCEAGKFAFIRFVGNASRTDLGSAN